MTTTTDAAARPRLLRYRYTAEERQRILRTVFLERSDGWIGRFATMMVLAVTIAALGLLADSPAIVIGAMLIAPLMTPIQALSVSVAMGWGRRMGRPALTVGLAVAGSVALAWLLAAVLPRPSDGLLPAEVLARTSPDLRDLLVALAAGAAGAYATAREDVSAALPGVAVAVALVPPLATIGICFQAGRDDLALGALLLFLTNLVAILLAGIIVLYVTGFVPVPHFRRVRRSVVVGVLPVLAATAFLAVPLAASLDRAVASANQLSQVNRRAVAWLGPDSGLEIDRVRIDGSAVRLDLVGTRPPPPVEDLAAQLSGVLGRAATVEVRWSLRQTADVAQGGRGAPDTDLGQLRTVATEWLASSAGPDARVTEVTRTSAGLVVGVAAPAEPPAAASLLDLLRTRLGTAPERVEVRWTQLRTYEATTGTSAQNARARAAAISQSWAEAQAPLRLERVDVTGSRVVVAVRGPQPPAGVGDLERAMRSSLGPEVAVEVRHTAEQVLTPGDEEANGRRRAAEATVNRWLGGRGTLTGVRIDGATVTVTVSGAEPPPPAAGLAEALGASLGGNVAAEVRWEERRGTDRAVWFPTRLFEVVPGQDLFPYGSAVFFPQVGEVLRPLADRLRTVAPGKRIMVAGHTDGPGSTQLNLDLSLRRAQEVRQWLIGPGGLAAERVEVLAYGEERPVAGNDTAEGRARNRRMEILVER